MFIPWCSITGVSPRVPTSVMPVKLAAIDHCCRRCRALSVQLNSYVLNDFAVREHVLGSSTSRSRTSWTRKSWNAQVCNQLLLIAYSFFLADGQVPGTGFPASTRGALMSYLSFTSLYIVPSHFEHSFLANRALNSEANQYRLYKSP